MLQEFEAFVQQERVVLFSTQKESPNAYTCACFGSVRRAHHTLRGVFFIRLHPVPPVSPLLSLWSPRFTRHCWTLSWSASTRASRIARHSTSTPVLLTALQRWNARRLVGEILWMDPPGLSVAVLGQWQHDWRRLPEVKFTFSRTTLRTMHRACDDWALRGPTTMFDISRNLQLEVLRRA